MCLCAGTAVPISTGYPKSSQVRSEQPIRMAEKAPPLDSAANHAARPAPVCRRSAGPDHFTSEGRAG